MLCLKADSDVTRKGTNSLYTGSPADADEVSSFKATDLTANPGSNEICASHTHTHTHIYIYINIYYVCVSLSLSVYLSICLSVCLSIYVYNYLSIYLSELGLRQTLHVHTPLILDGL